MKFKYLKVGLAGLVFIISNISQAGLIDADYQTSGDKLAVYDDVSGLLWLDLSVTSGVSVNNAENQFQGYHVATYSEWLNLFNQFFPNYVDGGNGEASSHSTGSNVGVIALHTNFEALLGDHNGNSWSFGLFLDGNVTKMGGSYYLNTTEWHTYREWSDYTHTNATGIPGWGVYMVKSVDVPEPSTLAIFGLALMGLASRKFKKS